MFHFTTAAVILIVSMIIKLSTQVYVDCRTFFCTYFSHSSLIFQKICSGKLNSQATCTNSIAIVGFECIRIFSNTIIADTKPYLGCVFKYMLTVAQSVCGETLLSRFCFTIAISASRKEEFLQWSLCRCLEKFLNAIN